ncbi:flagellar hook-length control protein FliK [Streptomyces sp. II-2-2-2]
MPAALLGGAAPAQNAGNTPSGARADSNDNRNGDRRDFDALLKPGSEGPRSDTPRKAGSSRDAGKHAATDTSRQDKHAATRPATSGARTAEDTPAPADAGTPASARAEKPAAETADDTEAAWPPLGLAGLALNGLPVPAPTPAVAGLAGPATGANAALPTLTAGAQAADGAAPALTPPSPSTEGGIALPALTADAVAADDAPLLKTFTDALTAATADGPDAPATPLLHALHGMTEAKPVMASLFTGSPTATPHLGGEDFDDAVGARVGWLADQKIGHAHIKITPNDLGSIDVRLQLDGDKVHASFTSAHADVRHALESSLPRLRELLGEQGFQLGHADVGQQQTAPDGGRGNAGSGMTGEDGEPALAETTLSPSQLIRQRGLVDAYA